MSAIWDEINFLNIDNAHISQSHFNAKRMKMK